MTCTPTAELIIHGFEQIFLGFFVDDASLYSSLQRTGENGHVGCGATHDFHP